MNIKCTPTQLEDTRYIDNLLDQILQDYISSNDPEKMNFAYRTGDLLGFARSELLSRIAFYLAQNSRIDDVFDVCGELDNKYPGPETSNTIADLIQIILELGVDFFCSGSHRLTGRLLEMARLAVKNSGPNELSSFWD